MVPAKAQVVIIGGGVMGTSAAFHLAEAGVAEVVLLERDQLAVGSTSRSAGGVRAQFSDPVNIELGARSLPAFERFNQRPGAEIDLKQVGYLFVHSDPETWAAAQQAVALQNSMGIATRLLTADQAGALSPGIRVNDILGATFHARDGYCSPESVVQGYAAGARAHGAIVRTGVEVLGVELSGNQIAGVRTSAGFIDTNTVICTAGVWSSALAQSVGVNLSVEPLRRQIVVTEPLDESLLAKFHSTMPMTIDAASTFYLHREGPGVLIGMSYQGETPGFHEGYSDEWLPTFVAAMEQRAPDLLDVGLAHKWAGYYEVTPDHNAVIGEYADVSRFLYATGFSGHGFLQGPAVGEVLRDLYLGNPPCVDVRSLSAERFAHGATVLEHAIV